MNATPTPRDRKLAKVADILGAAASVALLVAMFVRGYYVNQDASAYLTGPQGPAETMVNLIAGLTYFYGRFVILAAVVAVPVRKFLRWYRWASATPKETA